MSENKLKICSGNYNDGSKEFTGTYLDDIKDGKYYEWRVGVWMFWYPNGKSIGCDLLDMTESERYRTF